MRSYILKLTWLRFMQEAGVSKCGRQKENTLQMTWEAEAPSLSWSHSDIFSSSVATFFQSSTRWSSWLALRSCVTWEKKQQRQTNSLIFPSQICTLPSKRVCCTVRGFRELRNSYSLPPTPSLYAPPLCVSILSPHLSSLSLFPAVSMLESLWIMIQCGSIQPHIGVQYTHWNFWNFFFALNEQLQQNLPKMWK